MSKILDLVDKHLPRRISVPLILHILIVGFIVSKYSDRVWITILKKWNEPLPILIIAATASVLYVVLFVSYTVLCLKIRKNLRPKFGVLWDKDREPYCPIHERPLSRHRYKSGKTVAGVDCKKCKSTLELIKDDGVRLTLEEAKKQL